MADRPWTVVAKDNASQENVSFTFNSAYDAKDAAAAFKTKYDASGKYNLLALIPGEHRHVYIEGREKIKHIPRDQLFSGF